MGRLISLFMFGWLFLLAPLSSATAEANLPNTCPQDVNDLWDNCYGKYTDSEGGTYEGEWRSNKFHGLGKLTSADGTTISGEFQEGELNGYAIFKGADRSVYHGEWKNGVMHGYGKLVANNGTAMEGMFQDGKIADGNIILDYQKGARYLGGFKGNEFDGPGLLIDVGGAQYRGIFKEGKLVTRNDQLPISWVDERLREERRETTRKGIENFVINYLNRLAQNKSRALSAKQQETANIETPQGQEAAYTAIIEEATRREARRENFPKSKNRSPSSSRQRPGNNQGFVVRPCANCKAKKIIKSQSRTN